MQKLIERQSNFVRPFIDNINMINDLYNKPLQMLVDKDNLYIASVGVPRDVLPLVHRRYNSIIQNET